jgi:hypothetical protein
MEWRRERLLRRMDGLEVGPIPDPPPLVEIDLGERGDTLGPPPPDTLGSLPPDTLRSSLPDTLRSSLPDTLRSSLPDTLRIPAT